MNRNAPVTSDPTPILQIATGYMAAQQLFAASRIGLFKAIGEGAATPAEMAAKCAVTPRMARILADAMAAHGLLTRQDGRYGLTDAATTYLVGETSALDLAPFLTFLREISYPHWLQFTHTVDTDEPGDLGMTDERWTVFLAGVMTYNRLHADMFVNELDLSRATNALDIGGLASFFAIRAMQANPALRTTFAYAPRFAERIKEDLASGGVADRAEIVSVETTDARFDAVHDLLMINHVIHRFSAEDNQKIFANARAAAVKGAMLTVLDFFLDDNESQRAIDALHAAEYLVIDGTVVYPASEVKSWLLATGWKPVGMVSLPGSPRVIVAEAV